MKNRLASARVAGTLFLVAMVSSLAGAAILEPALAESDSPVGLGVALELIDAIAVLGIAVVLMPVMLRGSETMSFGYLGVRVLESASLTAAALIPVTVRSLAAASVEAGTGVGAATTLMIALRGDIHGTLVPLFFMVGSVFLYWLLYRDRLVPRFISIWGLLAVVALLVGNVAPISQAIGFVFAAPIILNEIFLGIWLIARGFEPEVTDARTA